MNHEKYFIEAGKVAEQALCLRDKCGAVIVSDGYVIGKGYNAPPGDDFTIRKCELELIHSAKPKSDRTCCVHAEWRAIVDALPSGKIRGSTLYFTRVDEEGALKESDGIPYCTVCSRLALDVGVAYFGLWTERGAKLWETREYNEMSYAFHQNESDIV